MAEPKLTIKALSKEPITFKPIQVYTETAELIKELSEETGLNKAKLVEMMISFAAEHIEIIKDGE